MMLVSWVGFQSVGAGLQWYGMRMRRSGNLLAVREVFTGNCQQGGFPARMHHRRKKMDPIEIADWLAGQVTRTSTDAQEVQAHTSGLPLMYPYIQPDVELERWVRNLRETVR